ncbi:roadblock/LC7 domain-containing protein [Streptomyces oryzae]|uniref:Roadblock/LC7 domain-containing protein n=1 Tax=Streptomyces oryzae TaxID=1434886 RepID=A0ABS3X8T9_9ACTN|nr:roadblock/LC7 domain-containing protein [Streptomyces oryzae]MBO8191467.1 roadblock/LC7 domain-containing protein [Streptomyces oryzae]
MVRQPDMDWMLKDLAESVPQTRHVVLLSSDGLCMAQCPPDRDTSDRLAAIGAGVQSLAGAAAEEFPHSNGQMRMVVMEVDGGFLHLMAAGEGAHLVVLVDEGVDMGLVGQQMRDLVARIGAHLTSPPRGDRLAR